MDEESKILFDTNLIHEVSKVCEEIRYTARKRCLQNFRDGESDKRVLKYLRQYLNILLQQIGKRLNQHSKYFLLYHFRRFRIVQQLIPSETVNWEREDYRTFCREIVGFLWFYNRITLATLKYGNLDAKDMKTLPPRFKGSTGYSVPNQLTRDDALDIHITLFLMEEYEYARYCMKRAGKGGKFIWKNRKNLEFDVVLEPDVQSLVNIFDDRAVTSGNLLSFSGTWAPIRISNEFPLSSGAFTVIDPWTRAVVLHGGLSLDKPIILTLLPNIAGQGKDLGWRDPINKSQLKVSPPWLFEWFYLDSIVPRIELFRGVIKKYLELSGRSSYEPEDLVFTLSAITQYQIKSCLENDSFWYQIFSYGYSVWSEPYELLKQKVLPEYRNLRKKSMGISPSEGDWERLKSVIEDIKWDEKKYKQIDILRFSPINLFYPIDKNKWLIDWSLMRDVILDLFIPYGRMIGTIAMLRGRDFQKALAEYFQSNADTLHISVWWLGHERGFIKFSSNGPRDVDIGLIVDNYLLIIEVKAYAGSRDLLIVGNPESLGERWENVVKPALQQVDTLSERLIKEPKGRNFKIPSEVKWIVPIVCGPFTEWIPSSDPKWWLYQDIPRVCTPNELLETMARIKAGNFPRYKLSMSLE